MIFALVRGNIPLRLALINGQIKPKDFIVMTEQQLASEETKKLFKHKATEVHDTLRTDVVREYQLSQNRESTIHMCFKCKSKKVTYFLLQTRSADEPMTAFFNCMECGNTWKR